MLDAPRWQRGGLSHRSGPFHITCGRARGNHPIVAGAVVIRRIRNLELDLYAILESQPESIAFPFSENPRAVAQLKSPAFRVTALLIPAAKQRVLTRILSHG